MQFGNFRPPPGVLYDADFGSNPGQALALCLLYGLDGKNETRVISISVSKPSLRAAGAAEIFGRFYAGAVSGAFGAVGRNLPTGLATEGGDPADTPMLRAVLDKKTAEGKTAYEHGLQSLNDTADPAPLLRNALTAQQDGNCSIVLNGPATNLAKLLDLNGAKDWITRKAKVLVMPENITGTPAHAAAARKVLAEWPGPVVLVGPEVGAALPYPGAAIESAFSWSTSHPMVDYYRAGGAMPYDTPGTELAAVLHAVREKDKPFGLSDPGTARVDDGGAVRFAPAAGGKHRRLVVDPARKDELIKTFVELTSAKPVPRQPRFRRPVVDPAKPAPPKPEAPKPADPKP